MIADWDLYVVTDSRLRPDRSHPEIARAAWAGGASVVQLRDKSAGGRALHAWATRMAQDAALAEKTLIINDRLDVALAVEVGAHVGQDDLPATAARRLLARPQILGVSASTVDEALRAEADGADYVGVAPIFEARGTKPDVGEPRGLELVRRVRESVKIPVVAIGGIHAGNAAEVIRAGAHCVALVSAVVCAPDMVDATARLVEIIRNQKYR